MICKGLLTGRKKLIEAVERETGQKAVYCGAPGFKYTIGDHTVLRDGSLETEDMDLVNRLSAAGLIEGTEEKEGISFPIENFTGRGLVNLVNSFAARERMLNKAVDHPNAFHMSVGLIRALKEENPATVSDFMDVLYAQGGEKSMKGLKVGKDAVSFYGFPNTPTFYSLANLMVKTAQTQGWVKPAAKETGNEKYSFRVWLNSLGMKGAEYKDARTELLSHFTGDSAFRTQELRIEWQKKKKKAAPEPDFIVL